MQKATSFQSSTDCWQQNEKFKIIKYPSFTLHKTRRSNVLRRKRVCVRQREYGLMFEHNKSRTLANTEAIFVHLEDVG